MDNKLHQAYSSENFRQHGHELIDLLADYLDDASYGQEEEKVFPWLEPNQQLTYWQQDFQKPLIAPVNLFQDVIAKSIQMNRKRYLGHQTTPVLPYTVLASAVTAMLNQGMGVYEMGLVGNALEKIMTEHLARKLGFGPEASGLITSGGSLGNLTALLAARAATTNVWNQGYEAKQHLAILVSEEAHYCIDRAIRIMGLGTEGIIKVPVNERFQMRTELLEQYYQQAISAGKQVFCVVGCAASTSTGSYDNLVAMATFCQQHQLWFHVDGAHGAPAVFSPKYNHLVQGIEKADSVIVDYHKMMMTPSLSTALIFKRGSDAYKTFSQKAEYLWTEQDSEEWYNGGKRTFECTKAMSVLSVYTIFRTYGEDVFRENIEQLYGIATTFGALIKENLNFELAYEPECNIVCFRFKSSGYSDKLNKEIRKLLVEEGRFYFVQTVLNGQLYLRVSLMNPLTTVKELQELLTNIEEKAARLIAN